MSVCVALKVAAPKPMSISVNVGGAGNRCMNHSGNNTSINVSGHPGLYCASVGYVEEKRSSSNGDNCATDESKWAVGYNVSGLSYSGSAVVGMESHWRSNAATILTTQPNGAAFICPLNPGKLPPYCGRSKISWSVNKQGPLAVIFTLPN
jgi:hypothetical protein